MWINNEVSGAVDLFWQLAGQREQYPRSLERPLALALPVALVKMPRLTLVSIEHYLRLRQVPFTFHDESWPVRGCLVAYAGKGMIFVDGADPSDEMRFSIAHEIGHFLIDYWLVRRKAICAFGPSIADVIDGKRRPNLEERFRSVMGGIRIGVHTNLLERQLDQPDSNPQIWSIEDQADRAALELLAPYKEILTRSDISLPTYAKRVSSVEVILVDYYGLPAILARDYASKLLLDIGKGHSWVESLRSH